MIDIRNAFGRLAAVALVAAHAPALAGELPVPHGEPILTVTGAITNTNQGDAAVLDLAMLEALPKREIKTSTIWTDDVHRFEGVPLADLIAFVGAAKGTLMATAINDYSVEIPTESVSSDAPIIAYRMDGAEMSVRDKGPLWVIYPYDSDASYQTEIVYSRSIWQLDRIAVVE